VVGLPARLRHTKCFLFESGRRDFSERDRLLLDLLRPRFVHLYESAQARRLTAALREGAEQSGDIIVLDSAGQIAFAPERALRLLRAYADGAQPSRLPAVVTEWLRHDREQLNGRAFPGSGRPLTIDRRDHRLVIRRVGDDPYALLVTEQTLSVNGQAPLTNREQEVLTLVEEGRSNAEIAAALWIAPGTVRTHLEHIYTKLGVQNRTAAVRALRSKG
jgi:DNA-binding CsgD family transcriptional regulator